MDRMEDHLRYVKLANTEMSVKLSEIAIALIGNEYSGGSGVVHRIKHNEEMSEKNKADIAIMQENWKLVKWFGSALGGLVISMILYLIKSN